MPKDLLKQYGAEDNFLDFDDHNLRAELIEFLLSSTPEDGFVGADGIFPRRGKVKSIVFAMGQIFGEPDTAATDNTYKLKLLKDRFRPADSAGVVNVLEDNIDDPNNEDEIFQAINLAERFPSGAGGSHLITQNGWIVRVLIATIEFGEADRRKLAFFWLPSRPLMFPVFCSIDGGDAGGPDTSDGDCTFTYTVSIIDESRVIETTISPERRRIKLTRYKTESAIDAGDGNSTGFAYYDPDGTLRLAFVLNELPDRRPHLVPVDCLVSGGVAGDEDTDCSFVYTVSDDLGVIKLTATPLRRRMPKTTYKTESTTGADDDESEGFGYWSGSGDFFLMMVLNELPDPEPCPASSGA